MNKYKIVNALFLLFVFVAQLNVAMAIGTEEQAAKLVKKGQYAQALPIYEELHILYPSDALFTYYYGVCLTETGNYTLDTRKTLLRSSMSEVPANVYYYIGINYHAQNDFKTALMYYDRFVDILKKKELKKYDVGSLKVQCQNEENYFIAEEAVPVNEVVDEEIMPSSVGLLVRKMAWNKENIEKIDGDREENEVQPKVFITKGLIETLASPTVKDSLKMKIDESLIEIEKEDESETYSEADTNLEFLNELDHIIEVELPESVDVPEGLLDANIEFNLTSDIFYSKVTQFKENKAKYYFVEGWKTEKELYSVLEKTDLLRNAYIEAITEDEKQAIAQKVIELEQKSVELKEYIDYAYIKAREIELEIWKNSSEHEVEALIDQNETISKESFSSEAIKSVIPEEENIVPEKIVEVKSVEPIHEAIEDIKVPEVSAVDTTKFEIVKTENKMDSLAELIKSKPIIKEKKQKKQQLEFRVQIGAFSEKYADQRDVLFTKLSKFGKIDSYIHANGLKLYTIGRFDNQKDAVQLQNKVRENGVKDAFVVVFYEGKRITMKEVSKFSVQ